MTQSYKKISALNSFPGAPDPNAVLPVSFMGTTYKVKLGDISNLVTKLAIGLGNVDNTSDISKPISSATQTALNTKANVSHSHTISDINNLSSYVQTSVADYFNTNPISAAVQQQLDNKSNLSHSHNYTTIVGLQNALDQKSDISHTHPLAAHTHTKAEVGLGNVDNTSDLSKPLSTAQKNYIDTAIANIGSGGSTGPHTHEIAEVVGLQLALSNLQASVDGKVTESRVNELLQQLVGLAPSTLDTLQELAASLGNNPDFIGTFTIELNKKANISHGHSIADVTGLSTALSDINTRINNIGSTGGAVSSVNSKTGDVVISKADVGLGNVDNTSDADKPISTATQTALNSKANQTHTHSITDTSGLRTELDDLSTRITNLSISGSGVSGIQDVPGLTAALDGKVDDIQLTNYYTKTETDGKDAVLQTAINNKSDIGHAHAITDVTGLTTALDNKAAINHVHTKADVGLGNVDNTSDANKPISTATQNALNLYVPLSSKGLINGVASLDATGKVPSSQLPSYVDDVLEFANLAGFPATGETGKIYVAIDTNYTYRWGGSSYVSIAIAGSGAVTSVNSKTGIVTLTKADIGLSNVDNTSDVNKPISAATQTALDGKAALSHTHTFTKADVGLNLVDNTSDASKPISTATQTALNAKVNTSALGVASGVATLDATGKVPSSQLPSYVDDVLEFANTTAFPATGSSGIIYVAQDTNSIYRWSGSAYVNLSSGSGGVTSVNSKTGVVTLTKADVGLGNVDNTSDLAKPISTATQTALNSKSDTGHIHAISDVSNLQTTLDGKSAIGHTHTKAEVGLGNVDNTSDINKPLSTAQKAYVDTAIASVSGGGAGGSAIIHNTTTRYEALSSTGYKVHCVSSSNIYSGLAWSRTGTSLTINHVAHGRSIGDRVIIKDTNVTVLNALITNVTTDSYTVDCADTGATSGTTGKYTCGFKFAHNSEVAGALTGGVLSAPANCDIQLLSMRIHTKANSRAGATYDLTIPTSAYNPAGANTSADDVYVPLTQIRADADTMTVVGNTIAMNQTGSYSIFRYAALGSVAQGQLMLLQF